ncbi:MAG: hypothetical protein AAF702_28380 [Chloroflexota bacterium]
MNWLGWALALIAIPLGSNGCDIDKKLWILDSTSSPVRPKAPSFARAVSGRRPAPSGYSTNEGEI